MENKEDQVMLIEQFDFSDLSATQRKLILKHSSEEEYTELRETVKQTIEYFDGQEDMHADKSLKPKIKQTGALRRLLNYKLPLHKVAAIIVVVLVADALLDNSIRSTTTELTEYIGPDTTMTDNAFIREIEEMKKYSSHNSIKYNTGLGRVHY